MTNLPGFKPFTHAVVCLDDDERTTVIARATSEVRAYNRLDALSELWPNATFDVYDIETVDLHDIPNTENEWNKEASPVWQKNNS